MLEPGCRDLCSSGALNRPDWLALLYDDNKTHLLVPNRQGAE